MNKNVKQEENPMFRMPGALLWLLCAPLAVVIAGHYEGKKKTEKWKKKRHKKAVEHWDAWWA